MTALGANPIPMNFTEVFTAMQNGTIDGFSSGISAVIDQKWHQVTKYCSITNDTWSPVAVMINRDFFNRLPPDLQEVVLSASRSAIAQSAVIYDEFDKSLILEPRRGRRQDERGPRRDDRELAGAHDPNHREGAREFRGELHQLSRQRRMSASLECSPVP